ncbi:MAG: nitroreductase family protein [Acidimicrobiales bacterium]
MELTRALARRRMVRAFAPDPIDRDTLDDLLDRARRAPSAGNTQATAFVVLDTPATTAAYWDVTLPPPRRAGFRWSELLSAPALVLVTTRPAAYPARYAAADKVATGLGAGTGAWPVPYWWVDAGAVIQNILLLAVDAGLGACLFGPFEHEAAVIRRFDLDADTRIVASIALGRPRPDTPGRSARRPRPPRDAVIHRPPLGSTAPDQSRVPDPGP